MDSKSILQRLDLQSIPCEYCDIRIEETFETNIRFNNHELTTALEQESIGAFLRVRKNGQWFYSATTDMFNLQEQLLRLASSEDLSHEVSWQKPPENYGSYENISYRDTNPRQIPLSEKVQLIERYDRLTNTNNLIKNSRSLYKDFYRLKTYLNSVGTFFQFDFTQCGGYIGADLASADKKFSDYYSLYGENFAQIQNQDEKIKKYLQEASQFLDAPLVTPGKYKLLLNPEVAGVFVHESFGHMSEADSLLGDPKAKEVWQIGKKVAADFVSIVDSGLHQGGSGYCPIDDEGFRATKTYLVKNGILAGRLHSYDTAEALQEQPTGNGRAMSFEHEPIVRMTSTYIENGKTPISELYKMAEGALLVENFNYGTGGELFTISPGRVYLVEDGRPKRPVRANVISGQLFETLLNIEALGDNFDLHHSALGGCGKMNQFPLPVSDGGPTILVKDMQVS